MLAMRIGVGCVLDGVADAEMSRGTTGGGETHVKRRKEADRQARASSVKGDIVVG